MSAIAQQLIAFAKSIEPAGGFFGPEGLVDVLTETPGAFDRFKSILASARAEELDGLEELDEKFGWLVMGAADELDLLPDDPRLFLSKEEARSLPDAAVLGALRSACIVNDAATVARLAKRVDVNSLDHNKQAPLCYAVGNNHPDCVRILLDHGANPNLVQNWGNTPMHIAASSVCSRKIFRMLSEAGGDAQLKNERGESVLDVLKIRKREDWTIR